MAILETQVKQIDRCLDCPCRYTVPGPANDNFMPVPTCTLLDAELNDSFVRDPKCPLLVASITLVAG